jgi:hypothetical protein
LGGLVDQFRGAYQQGLLAEGVDPNSFDPYGLAATGLLFAPGAGIADLTGNAPDPSRPGQMLPSFYENISGGNYLDAGLQALGGAGDAVQMMGGVFPPALAVGAAMKAPRGIRAFHGSPHHFDKFSLDKIGTGEGAQAYGHGLYFAEAEPTAMAYRDELRAMKNLQSDFDIRYKGDLIGNINDVEGPIGEVAREIKRSNIYPDKAVDNVVARKTRELEEIKAKKGDDPEANDLRQLLIDDLEASISEVKQINPDDVVFDKGAMYEVNIGVDPDMMLDYQMPLSQQPRILQAIEDTYGDPEIILTQAGLDPRFATGGQFVHALSGAGALNKENASAFLEKAGIPGIKYLDLGSRTGAKSLKDATSNYVVFDDATIEIMRKYGLLAPLVGAGTVAAVSDMGEDNQGIMY